MDRKDKKQPAHDDAEANWQYKPDDPTVEPSTMPAGMEESRSSSQDGSAVVEWSASEFIAHEKGFGWYVVLATVTLVVAAGLYVVTQDVVSVVVVLVMALILGIAGSRKPRVVEYRLDKKGLTVGSKMYRYGAYRSFLMPEDGPFVSVVLIPMKRFEFPISAYLAPDSQQEALDVLSSHLPMEHGKLDTIERLMRQLRF